MRAKAIAAVLAILTVISLSGRPLRAAEPQFRFQDNFWVNLHHFVRAEARRRAFNAPLAMPAAKLSDPEKAAWSSAVDAYADLAKLSLIFDERLVRINNALANQGEAAALPAELVEPGVLAALNRAAPVYRAHLWPEHRRANEEWIAATRPLVEQHAPALTRALADAYQAKWPAQPILVDASCEAGPVGAYTTGGPPGLAAHTVIAPAQLRDPAVAFETVFHEASHSVDDQIMKLVDAEAAKQGIKPHPELWHGIIFYTTGELVKRELHKEKDAGYQPYAYRFGVYDRGWQTLRAGLEKDWQPYLDGKTDFAHALTKLVADCPAPQQPAAPAAAAAPPASLEITVKPDVPSGYPDRVGRFATPLRQDLTSLQLTRLEDGRYGLRFSSGTDAPPLPEIDLRPFIPRVPLLAKGDPGLTRIALIQRELNRNQTRYPLPGRPETVFVANNCLRSGLWEIGLDRKDDKGTLTYYHGWFDFPKAEYARLFEALNGTPYAADLDGYPKLDGIPVPLAKMRSVASDLPVPAVDAHLGDPVDRFGEQERKAKLVLAPAARTYGDWTAADRQPVTTAKFSEPGIYDSKDPVRFDLAWLGHPAETRWRWVRGAGFSDTFPEIELRYANGYRLILADARLAALPARGAKPTDEADLLHLTFGIGTPEIYANVDERLREMGPERPAYLLLIDSKGDLVDNHHAGIDRIYLWREAGAPDRLHLYLVSYERIALVSHLSFAWPQAQ